jgi:hypothetical protein
MGLLARKLNVYMTGERQLLDENKERSGDNRAIRQNRTHRKSEADKQAAPALPQIGGANAVKAEGDKNPIGQMNSRRVIDPSRREELSAQRRKKQFKVWGINYASSFEPQQRISENTPWTATSSKWYRPTIELNIPDEWQGDYTQQRSNNYIVAPLLKWSPSFTKEDKNSRSYVSGSPHEIENVVIRFDWTFYQSNRPDSTHPLIIASLPQLPQGPSTWFQNHPRVSENHLPAIAASDGRYIWYSVVYATSRPSINFYRIRPPSDISSFQTGGVLNLYYDFQNDGLNVDEVVSRRTTYTGSPITDPASGYNSGVFGYAYINDNDRRYSGWNFTVYESVGVPPGLGHGYSFVSAYALTWRYDTENPQSPPNFSEYNLGYKGDGTLAGLHNFASMYLGLLDANHPAKEEWTKMLALKTANESFASLANRYFDPTYGSGFYSLVPGLVYYKDTGLAIYTGKLKRGNFFPNFPRVYTKTLTPNLSYSSASYRMPYPSSTPGSYFKELLTTHEDMIADGWEEQANAPVTQFGTALPYYFTHRLK